ncbi:MAG TPA: hypothetical protein VLA93_02890 [Pyrinomonadaceae bacterium]|nr:hypothetical protein [Pyrinomonadaceae bacterium]
MAEERTLGLARAPEQSTEDLSKEELQRRMDVARDSISNTVSEIKETVANQVQAVKDTLDWREQVKRRPVVWSVGALGVGFVVGYGVAAMVAGDEEPPRDYYGADYRSYAAQPVLTSASMNKQQPEQRRQGGNGHEEDTGPGFLERLTHTQAYGRVKDEVGDVGNNLIQELANTAKVMVVPAIITSLKKFLGEYLPSSTKDQEQSSPGSTGSPRANMKTEGYQPALERNHEFS